MAQYRRLRPPELQVKITSSADARSKVTLGVLLACLFWWLLVVVLVLIASAPQFLKLRRVGLDKFVVLGGEGHEIGFGDALVDESLVGSAAVDLSDSSGIEKNGALPDSASLPNDSSSKSSSSAGVSKPPKAVPVVRVPAALDSVNFKIEPLLNRRAPSLEENAHKIMAGLVRRWTFQLIDEAESVVADLSFRRAVPGRAGVNNRSSGVIESNGEDDRNNDCTASSGGEDGEFTPCNLDRFVADQDRFLPYVGLPICPAVPEDLVRERAVNLSSSFAADRAQLYERLESSGVLSGGEWMPRKCVARHKVIVVIPYRDRAAHLISLLKELHALLQSQQLHYKIIVSEQMGEDLFNKGMLMNAGFLTAIRDGWWDCVIFHDVDLVPEDGRNMYSCPPRPRHLSVAVDKLNYTLPYYYLMGGVVAFRTEHFLKVNGYSNLYWGWGGEDDDMGQRVLQSWSTIDRPLKRFGRYKMLPHVKRRSSVPTVIRRLLRTAGVRRRLDGLNSISFTLAEVSSAQRAYTRYLVDIGHPPDTISKLADIQQRQWALSRKLRRG